jgi:PAS domain S-box-containing protein
VGVAFDVTDIREAQARMMESETRFRTIADSAPAQMWMTDETGAVVFANKRYRIFFGVRRDEDLQANWAATMSANGLDLFYASFLSALKQRDRYEGIMEIVHPQMGRRWLRCEGIPRFNGAGQFQGYVGANIDVTEAKQAEEDLKRINELLEERVSEAMAEKAKAEADLMHAQRMEAVGRLTGGVAHDFNNLLTVVIGALDIMLRSPNDAAKRQKLGEAALAAARRGEGLTHQLLAFSRRQALRPEPVDLNAQIRESEPLLRRAVGEAVEFKLKLRRGGARVSVDPSQFEAALLNLVVNARDALGDKGGRDHRPDPCHARRRRATSGTGGGRLCLRERVGQRLGHAGSDRAGCSSPSSPPRRSARAPAWASARSMASRARAGGAAHRLDVGRGAEIRLYLPPLERTKRSGAPRSEPGPYPQAMAAARRLLLVEDDPSVRPWRWSCWKAMGMDVRGRRHRPQALELLKIERFDIMLSDVVMPGGMTGIELARECSSATIRTCGSS